MDHSDTKRDRAKKMAFGYHVELGPEARLNNLLHTKPEQIAIQCQSE